MSFKQFFRLCLGKLSNVGMTATEGLGRFVAARYTIDGEGLAGEGWTFDSEALMTVDVNFDTS